MTRRSSDLSSIHALLNNFRLDCDRYPTTEEGLAALRTPPADLQGKWKGPYTDKDIPKDPWNNDYHYVYPGSGGPETFDLFSYGADGQAGGEGENADIYDSAN